MLRIEPFRPGVSLLRWLQSLQVLKFDPDLSDDQLQQKYLQILNVFDAVDAHGCAAVGVEMQYIDRDFMEDYAVFYSRNLEAIPNHCARLHFFAGTRNVVASELRRIGGARYKEHRDYQRECRTFSTTYYLGFSVIKPLSGTPLGRTVIRPPDREGARFSTVLYHAHYAGVDLTLRGLAFQQQDTGVSACATTALWSALNKSCNLEEIATPTPAHITNAAGEFILPFGRSMPSDGLSIEQMCDAVRRAGLSPHLIQLSGQVPLMPLYTALRSGFAPVLMLQQEANGRNHAVTGVGYEMGRKGRVVQRTRPMSECMSRVFVHDDRIAPNVPATIRKVGSGVRLTLDDFSETDGQWDVSHIIIPLHAKVRISVGDLSVIALEFQNMLEPYRGRRAAAMTIDTWIAKGVQYFDELRYRDASEFNLDEAFVFHFGNRRTYSRYVGVIRLAAQDIGTIDVLIDTTSTFRNLALLAVAAFGPERKNTRRVADVIAAPFQPGCGEPLYAFEGGR